jgi:hypothetical protein
VARGIPAALIDRAILLLGAQRSGTTWLGKIFDSHPDVLYRHEPDELRPASPADPAAVRAAVAAWIAERRPRSAAKRPFFRKSWQRADLFALRMGLGIALAAAERLPGLGRVAQSWTLPDLGAIERARAAIKSVTGSELAGPFARALPQSRTVLILRHPCGQVASVMRGTRQGRFALREAGTDMPFDELRTLAFAADRGVTAASFQAMPEAARYAWAWRAFNEPAFAALAGLPNARVMVYEALCAAPEAETRTLFGFAGLAWSPQTAQFLAHSTSHRGEAGYYGVLRVSAEAAEAWRGRMPPAEQAAVREVVAGSSLAQLWPDLADGGAG